MAGLADKPTKSCYIRMIELNTSDEYCCGWLNWPPKSSDAGKLLRFVTMCKSLPRRNVSDCTLVAGSTGSGATSLLTTTLTRVEALVLCARYANSLRIEQSRMVRAISSASWLWAQGKKSKVRSVLLKTGVETWLVCTVDAAPGRRQRLLSAHRPLGRSATYQSQP